eukprot:jgi/Phyca11/111594/e_gw1.20.167.1
MPRISKRDRTMRALLQAAHARRRYASLRYVLDDNGGFENDIDDHVELQLEALACARYAYRGESYRKRKDKWIAYLDDDGELNDEEFLGHFRVSRSAFGALLELIRTDPLLKPSGRRAFRGGPELHLLILLKFLGGYGNDNSSHKLALFFGVGKGSIKNYVKRASRALLKLQDNTITWPDSDERELIAARIQNKYQFVNCVGLVDGTLVPLEFKPRVNGEDYFSRNGGYSLNALVICDDVARI